MPSTSTAISSGNTVSLLRGIRAKNSQKSHENANNFISSSSNNNMTKKPFVRPFEDDYDATNNQQNKTLVSTFLSYLRVVVF